MDKARIYVDFNEMVDYNTVLLSKDDTKVDSQGNEITFYEGMPVSIYGDDVDDNGEVDNLIAEGIAIRNDYSAGWQHVKWCCRIDANGIINESDLRKETNHRGLRGEDDRMKDSLKKFYEYLDSDEELQYYVRLNATWNEELFSKMKQVVRAVIKDYEKEAYYPKRFILYFMRDIPLIIDMLSRYKGCTEEELLAGYTEETYLNMIAEKIEQLKKFQRECISSLEGY